MFNFGDDGHMLDTDAVARSLTDAEFTPTQADAITHALRLAVEHADLDRPGVARSLTDAEFTPTQADAITHALRLAVEHRRSARRTEAMRRPTERELAAVAELLVKAERVNLLLKAGGVESNLTGIRLRGRRREDREYLDTLSRVAGRLAREEARKTQRGG